MYWLEPPIKFWRAPPSLQWRGEGTAPSMFSTPVGNPTSNTASILLMLPWTLDRKALYKDRIIISSLVYHNILDSLHATHQDVTSMTESVVEQKLGWKQLNEWLWETQVPMENKIDVLQQVMLIYSNTPNPENNIFPAMCIFVRPIQNTIPIPPGI